MAKVTRLKPKFDAEEWRLRVDLAAAFRLAVEFNWHESVGNHFSVAVSPDGKKFLVNPKYRHFARIKASDLLLVDSDDPETMSRPNAPERTAWCIHGAIHARLPQARCVLHVHPPYSTAIATLADPALKPIDQNTARYYNRLGIDLNYGGIATLTEEGERLAGVLGNHKRVILGSHGVLVAAHSVAAAFEDLYYLERACQTMVLAYSTGQKLNPLSHEIAEKTAAAWDKAYSGDFADAFFAELKLLLDEKDPSYAE
ncbi:MAG: class II aldolase/adducin family protein [Alphaproteobacteria bacterium]